MSEGNTMTIHNSSKATAALVLVTAIWGLTFPLVKDAVEHVPPLAFVAARFSLAALFMAPFALLGRGPAGAEALSREELKAGAILGGILFLGYAFQTIGLRFTSASNAGFITGASVVLVPTLVWLLDGTRIRAASGVGVALSFCGLALLTLQGVVGVNVGDALVLLCAIAFAAHIVGVGKVAARSSGSRIAWIQISACAVLSWVGALALERGEIERMREGMLRADVAGAIAFCAVAATAIAYWVQNVAQRHSTPVKTALIFTCEPVFSALCAYWLNGETLTALQVLGCGLMLVGMLCSEVGGVLSKQGGSPALD
jgi:drug/metabolite transporter (DMT)-like permease